ncbi:MAG: hypothetical protein HQK52_09225 [Oligoflexia bacterium]|nr:hypothetical protein [Oligoflexia bacterium]
MESYIKQIVLVVVLTLIGLPVRANGIDLSEMIPAEYKKLPVMPNLTSFTSADKARCKAGLRIGDFLGREFMAKFPVDCSNLLIPLADEWVVPLADYREINPLNLCFNYAYTNAVAQTVLNTAMLCADLVDQNFKLTMQMEYNRCYLQVAKHLTTIKLVFNSVDVNLGGSYIVIPKDSEEWDKFIDSLTITLDERGRADSSGNLKQACSLGIADATMKRDPANIFLGTRIPLGN